MKGWVFSLASHSLPEGEAGGGETFSPEVFISPSLPIPPFWMSRDWRLRSGRRVRTRLHHPGFLRISGEGQARDQGRNEVRWQARWAGPGGAGDGGSHLPALDWALPGELSTGLRAPGAAAST